MGPDLQIFDEHLQFLHAFLFPGRGKFPLPLHAVQFRIREQREGIHGNKIWIELAEQLCTVHRIPVSPALPRKPGHVDEIIFYPRLVQLPALLQYVSRRVPFPPSGDLQGNPAESGILTYRVWGELYPCPSDHDGMERDIPLPRLAEPV